MSNIGYAVFGSPKGIAVVSNGLFKELNLDKSLYLNSSHVSLEKRQQVLMLRRVPSDLNYLEKKDALLVVLYEQALQYGENRPGGFVGSAICFREKMPNSEKMISGLRYLFSKMKENVDNENRFKAIDASNWNISLPDTNKEFGMFKDEKLTYFPLSDSKKNIATKVYSLEKESASVLSNFVLNRSFHEVDYLYASDTTPVIQSLTQKGLIAVDFASLFNYNRHLDYFNAKITHESRKLKDLQHSSNKLESEIHSQKNEINLLSNKLVSKQTEIQRTEQSFISIEQELKDKKQQLQEAERDLHEMRRLGNPTSQQDSSQSYLKYIEKIKELRSILADARETIQEHTSFKFTKTDNVSEAEENQFFVKHYFERLPKKKRKIQKRNGIIFSILLLSVFACLGLFFLEKHSHNATIASIDKKPEEEPATTNVDEEETKQKQLFADIEKYEKRSSTADYNKFKENAKILLANFKKGKYKEDSEEFKFIKNYPWEFWEFDYTDKKLVDKIELKDDKFFTNIPQNIKPLKLYLVWNGKNNIDQLLKKYLKEDNDIYENLSPEITNDITTLKNHFQWIIEKCNGKIETLEVKKKIKLPFFKK